MVGWESWTSRGNCSVNRSLFKAIPHLCDLTHEDPVPARGCRPNHPMAPRGAKFKPPATKAKVGFHLIFPEGRPLSHKEIWWKETCLWVQAPFPNLSILRLNLFLNRLVIVIIQSNSIY